MSPRSTKKLRMNNRATPHSADEGAETKVLAHVRGLKSVLPQLCSSMQPRSDHQRCSGDHPMQSKQTPTAARRSAGDGAGWVGLSRGLNHFLASLAAAPRV